MFKFVVEEFTVQLGASHSRTLDAMCWHAFALDELGEAIAARKTFEEVVKGRIAHLGPLHMDTLTAQCNLAILHKRLGEVDAAKQLFILAHKGFCQSAGAVRRVSVQLRSIQLMIFAPLHRRTRRH